jgi:organic hydroperoxide reductase OsmC/OhrA
MAKTHHYSVTVKWTGNTGAGTSDYRSYERRHEISADAGKLLLAVSSDSAFRGDPALWNPEELLIASLSACHKLWYLHFVRRKGIVVAAYIDQAEGVMEESADGSRRFRSATLSPEVTVGSGSDLSKARALHETAHAKCFIANSANFPVQCEPKIVVA